MSSRGENLPTTWSVAAHDPVPQIELGLDPLESHAYLFAFLRSDGAEYVPPYSEIRASLGNILTEAQSRRRQGQSPTAEVSDQRLRTWRSLFENFGIISVTPNDKRLHLTPLGRSIKQTYDTINEKLEGANDRLAMIATDVLSRHTLRNPVNGTMYPEDSDVHPYRFMWRAMRRLDNKLHWEELNRVIMHVLYVRDEDAAIDSIRESRKAAGGVYDQQSVKALGAPTVSDGAETQRRISTWLSQAGFGGYLINSATDQWGFRHLASGYIQLIDDALDRPQVVPEDAKTSPEGYLRYLNAEPRTSHTVLSSGSAIVEQVASAAGKFGSKKIICLSGIPGTGKTHLARIAGMSLADNDPYRFAEIQFHPGSSYEDFVEGFVPKPAGDGFELQSKVLRIMNRRARLDPDGKLYVLLIEEFTRADIQAVLGELLTYIEHRNRSFRFAISNQEDQLAPNLVVLATMNPRDKTSATLDHAVLRRLHRVDVPASAAELRNLLADKIDPSILDQLHAWFEKYVSALPFGHAEFADVRTAVDLYELWSGTLLAFLTDINGVVRDVYVPLEETYPWRRPAAP